MMETDAGGPSASLWFFSWICCWVWVSCLPPPVDSAGSCSALRIYSFFSPQTQKSPFFSGCCCPANLAVITESGPAPGFMQVGGLQGGACMKWLLELHAVLQCKCFKQTAVRHLQSSSQSENTHTHSTDLVVCCIFSVRFIVYLTVMVLIFSSTDKTQQKLSVQQFAAVCLSMQQLAAVGSSFSVCSSLQQLAVGCLCSSWQQFAAVSSRFRWVILTVSPLCCLQQSRNLA